MNQQVRGTGGAQQAGSAGQGIETITPTMQSATTGITINNATVTINDFAGGAAANMPPAMMTAYALFAGA
jgi:hypothetical protein